MKRQRLASHRPLEGLVSYADTAVLDMPAEAGQTALPRSARWGGVLGVEGELTGDGRAIAPGALRWPAAEELREQPLEFRFVKQDMGLHDGAVVVAGIDRIERRDGGVIWGEGPIYVDTEEGADAYVAIKNKRQNGVSLDLDDLTFEWRVAEELYDEMQAMMDSLFAEPEDMDDPDSDGSELDDPGVTRNDDGTVTVGTVSPSDEIQYTTDARIRAATDVAIPAFDRARIEIIEEDFGAGPEESDADAGVDALEDNPDIVPSVNALIASGIPALPPRAWFEDPQLSGPTPLRVEEDGRIYGHLALWGTCHRTHTREGQCITPPNSAQDYAQFHLGEVLTAEGDFLAVGTLTMSTGHAKDRLTLREAQRHYDETGTVAGQVRAYEDAWGIAVAGAAMPDLSPSELRKLRSCPLSGDWRRAGYSLELVAALAVPVPGYGIPRVSGHLRSGKLMSLTASGMIIQIEDDDLADLSPDDVSYLRGMIERDRRQSLTASGVEDPTAALAALRHRVQLAEAQRRVRDFARARRGH